MKGLEQQAGWGCGGGQGDRDTNLQGPENQMTVYHIRGVTGEDAETCKGSRPDTWGMDAEVRSPHL